MSEPLKTPLYDWHVRRGGRMVEFAGWHMPAHYSGLVEEHIAVRERAGLFDVSHMGEIRVRGTGALEGIQRLTVNDASGLEIGQAQYTAMTNEAGGVVDDLLVYRLEVDDYLLVVNAAATTKDFEWIAGHVDGDVEVVNESGDWAQLALQGPAAEPVLQRVFDVDLESIRYYRFATCKYGEQAIVSRTGYTGEDGFEIYLPPAHVSQLADAIIEAGAPERVQPAGLGARDTLRLEAGMLLYDKDMDEERTPLEAGLSWIVKPDKGEFVGRQVFVEQKAAGPSQKLVGLKVSGRGIPRRGYPVLGAECAVVGTVTSGTFSPTLEQGIGLAYVDAAASEVGTELTIEIRGRNVPAEVVKPPFYRRPR